MAAKKSKSKQGVTNLRPAEIADQLEHAFLAGLGALTNPQDIGSTDFDSLVKKGKSFRKKATNKTEELIDDVQGAIRGMADDAQSTASGLLDQMRETPQLDKLQTMFDSRVAVALERVGVASKNSLDDLNKKLDRVLSALEKDKRGKKKAKRTAKPRKKATKKTARKKAAKKKSTAKLRKTATKKTARKKAAKKKSTAKRTSKKASKKRVAKKRR